MNGEDLFRGLNYVNAKFIDEAETVTQLKGEKKILSLRRPVLIAALITMLLMLVGCAVVYVLRMKEIHIGQQQTYQDVFEYDPDTGEAIAYIGQEPVTEEVLTLAGIQGSRNYQAAQEWFAFKQEYDPDFSIAAEMNKNGTVPDFPAEYGSYNIYSREMKDKLDEILEKYDLKLIGKTIPFRTEELVCKALGLENILVPGSSAVYKGGVICYTNEIKHNVLGVSQELLERYGAVSQWVAGEMVSGVRKLLNADVAVSVTGLAGPGGDEYGHPVGTVYIGYEDRQRALVRHYLFEGDREAVRSQTIDAALRLILEYND